MARYQAPQRSPADNNAPNRLLNEHEAADILGLSVKTLRRWRWAGRPPRFIKIGSAVRYDPADLQNLIEAGRRNSTSAEFPSK